MRSGWLRIVLAGIDKKEKGNDLLSEEEDAALIARMRNRPDATWLRSMMLKRRLRGL